MKTTTSATLNNEHFYIETDGFELLSRYLESIKIHFIGEEGREIAEDIEARIAERFRETGKEVISMSDVEAVVEAMGSVERFDAEANQTDLGTPRRLFRDSEDVVIAGVASGLAAYFNLDPLIIRLLFIVSIFAGGTGIILYLLLWLLVPQAQTTAQKLEMHGRAITLASLSRSLRKGLNQAQGSRGSFQRIILFPFEVLGALLRFLVEEGFPFLSKLIGFGFIVFSSVAALTLTTALFLFLFNQDASYVEFPIMEAVSPLLFYAGLAFAYFAILLPLILGVIFGMRLLKARKVISSTVTFGILGVWMVVLIASAVAGTKIAGQYATYMNTSPEYAQTTEVKEIEAFTGIESRGRYDITISQGEDYAVTLHGRKIDLDQIILAVPVEGENTGNLVIETKDPQKLCLFGECDTHRIGIDVTVPDIKKIAVTSGTSVRLNGLDLDSLTIENRFGAEVTGELAASTLHISSTNASTELSGSADEAAIDLHGGNFVGTRFEIQKADVLASDYSNAEINALQALTVAKDESSTVIVTGTAEVTTASSTAVVDTEPQPSLSW